MLGKRRGKAADLVGFSSGAVVRIGGGAVWRQRRELTSRWVTVLLRLGQNGVLASSKWPVSPVLCGERRCASGGAGRGVRLGEAGLDRRKAVPWSGRWLSWAVLDIAG